MNDLRATLKRPVTDRSQSLLFEVETSHLCMYVFTIFCKNMDMDVCMDMYNIQTNPYKYTHNRRQNRSLSINRVEWKKILNASLVSFYNWHFDICRYLPQQNQTQIFPLARHANSPNCYLFFGTIYDFACHLEASNMHICRHNINSHNISMTCMNMWARLWCLYML